MKRSVRILSILLVLAVLILGFVGCGSEEDSSDVEVTNPVVVNNESQAINAVKNYKKGTAASTEQFIAGEFFFDKFYSPEYGDCEAELHTGEVRYLDVTLYGTIAGYSGKYGDNFNQYRFKLTARVDEYGSVTNLKMPYSKIK